MSDPRNRRSHWTTIGIALVLIVTAICGASLVVAVRRLTIRRAAASAATLHDYMEYAVGIASDAAQWDLLRALRARMMTSPRGRIFGEWPGTTRGVTIDRWGATGAEVDACNCLAKLQEVIAFRYDPATRRFESHPALSNSDAIGAWIRDTLDAERRTRPDSIRWFEIFSSPKFPGLAIAARVVDSAGRREPIVYGYVGNVRPWIAVAMSDMLERAALFPTALSARHPNASLLRLVARTALGDTLYDSGALPSRSDRKTPAFVVRRSEFGGMIVDVFPGQEALALFARVAEPGYGAIVPLSLVFMTLLIVIATLVVLLRREAEVGRRRWSFAASVSHELRTPLTQILLFAERLRDRPRTSESNDPAWHREVDVIVRETERMRYLVENVLHVARQDPPPLRTELARVAPIVEEVVDRYESVAQLADIPLILEVERDIIAAIDRGAVEQIVLNLLDNALKHATDTRAIHVGVGYLEGAAALWVDDGGPGIPLAERGQVWDAFARGTSAKHSATPGSGLGLSVVRDLAHALHARVRIDTSPLGGARFVIFFGDARPAALHDTEDAA